MNNHFEIRCGDSKVAQVEKNGKSMVYLSIEGPSTNVTLKFDDLRRSLYKKFSDVFLDLIEIATYVYSADQAVGRSNGGKPQGTKENPEIGLDWRRKLRFHIPVRCPERWRRREVLDTLVSTLGFLSDDEYEFVFEPMRTTDQVQGYFDFKETEYDGKVHEVVLFSGGLDSLAGAIQESVNDGRRVLLVNHRSSSKLSVRIRDLLKGLDRHAGASKPFLLPIRVNKKSALTKEYTQRSRSFLCASLAAMAATSLGLQRIRFYENGVVSLNLPLSPQVVGGRATRTTHPRVLQGFGKLFGLLSENPFEVQNPFLWKTKTDVVRLIAESGCSDLIGLSTSCAHTRNITLNHTHCGVCSQCVDRRFAVLAAGVESYDPVTAYRTDLMVGDLKDGEPVTMLAAYVETARRVAEYSSIEFFSRFGEASRVFRHVGLTSTEAARRIYELYRRHGKEVKRVLKSAITEHFDSFADLKLPRSCLVNMMLARTDPDGMPVNSTNQNTPVMEPTNIFRRRGEVWEFRYRGGEKYILRGCVGASYIHLLLSRPGKSRTLLELTAAAAKRRLKHPPEKGIEVSDLEALKIYRLRKAEIEKELEEATQNNDTAEVEQLTAEREWMMRELKNSESIGGRLRKVCDESERIRKAQSNAVKRVLEKIGRFSPEFADHLTNYGTLTGRNPVYLPPDDMEWETE